MQSKPKSKVSRTRSTDQQRTNGISVKALGIGGGEELTSSDETSTSSVPWPPKNERGYQGISLSIGPSSADFLCLTQKTRQLLGQGAQTQPTPNPECPMCQDKHHHMNMGKAMMLHFHPEAGHGTNSDRRLAGG